MLCHVILEAEAYQGPTLKVWGGQKSCSLENCPATALEMLTTALGRAAFQTWQGEEITLRMVLTVRPRLMPGRPSPAASPE